MITKITSLNTLFSVRLFATFFAISLFYNLNAQVVVGSTTSRNTNNNNTQTFSHEIQAGENRLLLVNVSVFSGNQNRGLSSVSYNGQPLQELVSNAPAGNNRNRIHIYYLINPPVGNHNMVVNFTSGSSGGFRATIGVVNFSGVNQSNPFGNIASDSGNGDDEVELQINTNNTQLVFGAISSRGDIQSANGQTSLFGNNGINNGDADFNAAWRNAGNNNTRIRFLLDDEDRWAMAVIAINRAVCGNSLATHHFRTKTSGDWSNASTWESSVNKSTWCDATLAPTSAAASVEVRTAHIINVDTTSSANNLIISGTLNSNANLQLNGDVIILNGTWDLKDFNGSRINAGGSFEMRDQARITVTGENNFPSNFSNYIAYPTSEVNYAGTNQTVKVLHSFIDNYNGDANSSGNSPSNTVSNNTTPASYGNLILSGNGVKTLSSNYLRILGNFRIENQAKITVNSNQAITIGGIFTNETGLASNVTFEDEASLIQIGNITTAQNSGAITYKRSTNPLKHFDFVYWGSMVENQNLMSMWMTNAGGTFYRYNPNINNWAGVSGNTTMAPGVGYIARARHNSNGWAVGVNGAATVFNTQLIGTPRTGSIEVDVLGDRWNLVANPYPTAIHFREFAKVNNVNLAQNWIHANAYIWTQTTPITNNSYTASDYAVYSGHLATGTRVGNYTAKNHIAAGQAFFVRTKQNATKIAFTDQMKIVKYNYNFTKPGGGKDNNEQEEAVGSSRIWLNFSNASGDFKQIAIVHTPLATNSYEEGIDALAFNGNGNLNFFSVVENNRISIQGRETLNINDEYPLGYQATTSGNYTISLDNFDGQFLNQDVFIVDMLLNVVHNLKSGNYTFNSASGTHLDRFKVKYYDETLSVSNNELTNLVAFTQNNALHIKTSGEILNQIEIFDIQGRTLQTFKNVQQTQVEYPLNISNQIILVKCIDNDGKSTTKKLIF
ncbi:MAG: hypothetical protein KGZ81_02970 [Flavobacteriales bacterium]|nr:hypothetical protein [Flavobacteriales bacterium]